MNVQLQAILDLVNDEQSFLRFLQALAEDWQDEQQKELANPSPPYSPGANGWENGTIGAYLDAAFQWGIRRPMASDSMKSRITRGSEQRKFFTWVNYMNSSPGPSA